MDIYFAFENSHLKTATTTKISNINRINCPHLGKNLIRHKKLNWRRLKKCNIISKTINKQNYFCPICCSFVSILPLTIFSGIKISMPKFPLSPRVLNLFLVLNFLYEFFLIKFFRQKNKCFKTFFRHLKLTLILYLKIHISTPQQQQKYQISSE